MRTIRLENDTYERGYLSECIRKAVGLCRVSTGRQGLLGPSFVDQQRAIIQFARERDIELKQIFGDVESGVRAATHSRELSDALDAASKHGRVLIVTDVSRLGRDVSVADLVEKAGVRILAIDVARVLTYRELRQRLEKAQEFVERLRAGTRNALDRARRCGTKLGNPQLAKARYRAAIRRVSQSQERTEEIYYALKKLPGFERMPAAKLANHLNATQIRTGKGNEWTARRLYPHLRRIKKRLSDL